MRVPLTWLRELVEVDVGPEELAVRLSMTGAAVNKIHRFAPGVSGIVVGHVLEVTDVAESDKLCIAQVDAGDRGRVQVLAGAKNFTVGDKVPLAVPGARVTTLDVPVATRAMVGGRYESEGMLCSAKELGISDDHGGILVLPADTPLGADVAELLGLDDHVLEFEIYPNRPDLMSVIGVAREVALLYSRELRRPSDDVREDGPAVTELSSVAVEDPAGCPHYLARVIEDVGFGVSPALVQARLSACGMRPLGNLIDATNYVLLLTGQPLHAFDLDLLHEERIVVRRARSGETLTTIDEEIRALDPEDLVIADAKDAQALAGVMGGRTSEVGPSTKRVLLESAYFDPLTIARTARKHRMRTEASSRFERGADPRAVPWAAAMAAEMMRTTSGGVVARGAIDVGTVPDKRTLVLRPERVETILGVTVPAADRDRFLIGIGCEVAAAGSNESVTVPSWRPDLEREIDLIEEIARLHGYENVPSRHLTGRRGGRSKSQRLRERVRDVLLGAGLNEATLSTFVHADDVAAFGYSGELVHTTNPMTEDQQQLRPSLFPGLMRAAQRNIARGAHGVRLFELGTVFTGWPPESNLPAESEHVAVALAGNASAGDWSSRHRAFDAFDLKGILELVLGEIGVDGLELRTYHEMPFHPGRSAALWLDGERVGRFGEIRPSVARAFDLESAVVGGLALPPLFARAPDALKVRELPTQPPVLRDVAMAVSDDVAAADVVATIREAGGSTLESVTVVDVYRGEQVGAGRRSLAFRLVFRAPDRTLTAVEADGIRAACVEACRMKHGAEIR